MADIQFTDQEIASMRALPGGVFVPPSGDTTGETDTAAIQSAIDAESILGTDFTLRAVYLSGVYYLARTLDNSSRTPVCLVGMPHAALRRVGKFYFEPGYADDYMLRMVEQPWNASCQTVTRLANISFQCYKRSRGVLLSGMVCNPRYVNITIADSVKAGLDLCHCYTSSFQNVSIYNSFGYALRTNNLNNVQASNIHIAGNHAVHHAKEPVNSGPLTTELEEFATQHGMAAARAKYGTDLVETWPDDDDAVACFPNNTAWNIQTDKSMQHAPCYVSGVGSRISNLAFENCRSIDDPLLVIAGECLRFDTIYDEGNMTRLCKIRLNGTGNGMAVNNSIQNMLQFSASVPTPCEALVEAVGESCNNTVEDVYTQNISKTYLRHNGGTHRNNVVRNALDCRYPSIPQANWITEVNGATHEQTVPTGLYG